ncbi:MAG: TRAP transporter small permease [Rubrivivax sp.]
MPAPELLKPSRGSDLLPEADPQPGNAIPPPGWIAAIHAVSRLFGVFAAGLILVSIGVVCQMVFVRAVLNQSSIWQTEFVTFSLIASTFLGAPYILLTRGHVAVDVVPLMLRPPARRALYLLGSLIALGFCLFFLYGAWHWWHEVYTLNQTTSSIWRARLWIPYAAVPLGLALLCLQYVAEIVQVMARRENPFGLAPDDRL